MSITSKQLPESERPYEKCLAKGAEFLSDAELLAVIIRTGTSGHTSVEVAKQILEAKSGSLLAVHQMSLAELRQIPGIGKVKAIQLKCVAELSKRIAMSSRVHDVVLQSARSVASYYMERLRHEEREHVLLCMFDTRCRLIRDTVISVGTATASLVSPREIFLKALEYHAVHIILVHNHPSGDIQPSRQDIQITRQLLEGGRILGIALSDHIIIGDNQYFSFREQEMLFASPEGERNVE